MNGLFFLKTSIHSLPLTVAMATNPSKRLSSSIAVCYDISEALIAAGVLPSLRVKRLRRLPHLFSRVLELPIGAWSSVQVQETNTSFTFSVALPVPDLVVPGQVRAEVTEIVPGITKVSIAGSYRAMAALDELDIPPWRYRLPETTLLESSTASCGENGMLVLIVPKSQPLEPAITHPCPGIDEGMLPMAPLLRESGSREYGDQTSEPDRCTSVSSSLDISDQVDSRTSHGTEIFRRTDTVTVSENLSNSSDDSFLFTGNPDLLHLKPEIPNSDIASDHEKDA